MTADTKTILPTTDAAQEPYPADGRGTAVSPKSGRPRQTAAVPDEYDVTAAIRLRQENIRIAADTILAENMEAFLELAK